MGGVVPELVDSGRIAYVVLGCGYAVLAAGVFAAAALRRSRVERALRDGEWAGVGERGVLTLTLVGMALAVGTLVVIVTQA